MCVTELAMTRVEASYETYCSSSRSEVLYRYEPTENRSTQVIVRKLNVTLQELCAIDALI